MVEVVSGRVVIDFMEGKKMKGLKEMVLTGALALGVSGCEFDERKDFVVAESEVTCAPLRLVYEQRGGGLDTYRLECYGKSSDLVFRTAVGTRDHAPTLFCFKQGNCVALYSAETVPVQNK